MLTVSSTMTRVLTVPIHVLWKPVSFLVPVRSGVVICMKLIACMDPPPTVGSSTHYAAGRGFLIPDGVSCECLMVKLSRTPFRLSDLVDPPHLPHLRSGYTGVSRRYTGVIVSPSEAIVFRFPPFDEEIQELSAALSCTDDDTQIQSSPGEAWPDSVF